MALNTVGFDVRELVRDLGGVTELIDGIKSNTYGLVLDTNKGASTGQGLETLDLATDFTGLEESLPH